MSRRLRWAPVALALVVAACGGSSDDEADVGVDAGGGTTTSAAPSTSATPTSAPTTTGAFGPSPLVPSPGQRWSDLYPDGAPPVFPLPGSSRALTSPQAAATAFARDMLGMESADVAVESQDAETAVLTLQGSPAGTRLELRQGELGWEVVAASADGLDLAVTGTPSDGGPTGVDRTIDVTGASGAPAGTTLDVVDLADGRLVLRQSMAAPAAGASPAAGPVSVTLPDPLPQLAAVIFYVPEDGTPTDPTAARRASAASVSPVYVQP